MSWWDDLEPGLVEVPLDQVLVEYRCLVEGCGQLVGRIVGVKDTAHLAYVLPVRDVTHPATGGYAYHDLRAEQEDMDPAARELVRPMVGPAGRDFTLTCTEHRDPIFHHLAADDMANAMSAARRQGSVFMVGLTPA